MHCRLEYIKVGTPSESLWAQFLDSLSEISEARAHVMLYESPVDGLDLSLKETVALHSSSLLVIPPPPPGHSPLSGHRGQILAEASLPKWASLVQEVASGMRQLPLEAETCPPDYYDSLLSRLSTLAGIPYCRQCYKLGPVCTCPKGQPARTRWARPVQPYTGTTSIAPVSTMAGSIPTWASTSAGGDEVPKTPYQQQIQVPSGNRIVRYQAPKAKPNKGSL